MGARVVDISGKRPVRRIAVARGFIALKRETLEAIKRGRIGKGDVETVASLAAVLAVKDTPRLVPLAHPIPIESVEPVLRVVDNGVEIEVKVVTTAKTGVEMEALAGVMAGLLAVWDMVKSLEKDERGNYPYTEIRFVRVESKIKEPG